MKIEDIKNAFKLKGFSIIKVEEIFNGEIIVVASKDYAEKFTINFNGRVILRTVIMKDLYSNFNPLNYPRFYEESNLIERKTKNHIGRDGAICYAPFLRPIMEKWRMFDFVVAVDSVINDYFNKEYIGRSTLRGLKHGKAGLIQYSDMISQKAKRVYENKSWYSK